MPNLNAQLDLHSWMAMGWPLHALATLIGLCIGSFLNVVIARLPHGMSLTHPPSSCPNCRYLIRWYDNIPLFSYFFLLRAKCRQCKKPISFRYPMVELLVGLLFLTASLKWGWTEMTILRIWPYLSLMVAITFIDLDLRIIPDKLSLGGLVLGLATCWLGPAPWWDYVVGAAVGFGVFFAFSWLYYQMTRKIGLGGGDIKLLAMIGSFQGLEAVVWTVLMSSVLGSIVGVTWALARGQKNVMTSAIPYGPFLVLGAFFHQLIGIPQWPQFMILI